MRRIGGIVAALGIALLAVTACSSGDDGGGDAGPTGSASARPATVRVVGQNLLHGIFCPEESDRCELPARVELFTENLADAGCPEIVGAQEANQRTVDLLEAAPAVADCGYEVVWDDDEGVDREVVLTTLDVLATRRVALAGPLRTAWWVRVASDVGVVEYVTTHLASGSDDRPCTADTCPPPCEPDDRVNTCQMRQVLELVDGVRVSDDVVVVGGDLNAEPDSPTIDVLRAAGYVDTHVEAGNPECDPATGAQCTSGREDEDLSDLTDPTARQRERIDYLWLLTDRDCSVVPGGTGLFDPDPSTTGSADVVWASDHSGVEAEVECATTAAQVEAATDATVASSTTTSTAARQGDAADIGAITEAYQTVFDGDVTDAEVKLASLEDADELHDYFLESYAAVADIAARTRVRVDAIDVDAPDHADVTYSILLEDVPVLDHLPGEAVRVDGRWLVARRTYCDVSTQGADEIPPPCR